MARMPRTSSKSVSRSTSHPLEDDEISAPSLRDTSFVTDEFLPYLLNQITNLWNRNLKGALKRSPVSVKQWRVLSVLCRRPGMSLTELVEKTAIDQPTLSRMVDQLNALGLLKRETAEGDARFLCLSLTPDGEALIEDLWPVAWTQYRAGVGDLTPEEEALLIKLLKRVLDSAQNI